MRKIKPLIVYILLFFAIFIMMSIGVLWTRSYREYDYVRISLGSGRSIQMSSLRGTLSGGVYYASHGKSGLGIIHDSMDLKLFDRGLSWMPPQIDLSRKKPQPWIELRKGRISRGSKSYGGCSLDVRYSLMMLLTLGVILIGVMIYAWRKGTFSLKTDKQRTEG